MVKWPARFGSAPGGSGGGAGALLRSRRAAWGLLTCAALLVALAGTWWRSKPDLDPTLAESEPVVEQSGPDVASGTQGLVGFAETFVDIGQVPWGTDVPVSLAFANGSDEPVTIESVEASCGCALVLDADGCRGRALLAGDQIQVDVSLGAGTKPGLNEAFVKVGLADGRSRGALVRWDVVPSWTLSADLVQFGKVYLDEPEVPAVTVAFSSHSCTLVAVQPDVSWLECEAQSLGPGGRDAWLTLRLKKERLSPGVNRGMLMVTTTDRTVPTARVLVTALGSTALVPYPYHLVLVPGSSGAIRFSEETGRACTLVSAEATHPAIRVQLRDSGLVQCSFEAGPMPRGPVPLVVRDESGRRGCALISVILSSEGGIPP